LHGEWAQADQLVEAIARVRAKLVRKRIAWCMIRVSALLNVFIG
jgi:hypothetical protein